MAKKKLAKPGKAAKPQKAIRIVAPVSSLRLGVPFIIVAGLRAVAALFPEARLWGLNYLAFIPDGAAFFFVLLGLLLATPLFYAAFSKIASALMSDTREPRDTLLPFIFGLAGIAVFWLLRMETYFLGDGAVYLAELYRYTAGESVAADVLFSTYSAPLTGRLIAELAMVLRGMSLSEGSTLLHLQAPFWISGALAGGAYIYLAFISGKRLFRDAETRLAFTLLLLFTPGVLFFFGYVEYYTFFFLAAGVFFYLLLRAFDGDVHPVWPALTFAAMSAFHIMGLVLAPSLLLLLIHRYAGDALKKTLTFRNVTIALGAALLLGGIYYFASGIYSEGSRIVLALLPFGEEGAVQQYTLLSSWHLIDILNMLFLLTAAVLPILFYLPLKERLRSPASLAMLLNLGLFSYLLLFGYTCFGMARDWDVNAAWALALLFFIASMLRGNTNAVTRYLLYLAAGASLAAALPWLAVNINAQSSVQRFNTVMALDDRHVTGDFALNGYEHLRKYHQSVGDSEGVIRAIQKKIEAVGYPLDYRKLFRDGINPSNQALRGELLTWLAASLLEKLREMESRGSETSYAGSRQEYLEIYLELVLEAHGRTVSGLASAGTADGPSADDLLGRLRAVIGSDPMADLVTARIEEDRSGTVVPPELYTAAARRLDGSATLALGIAQGLMASGRSRETIEVLEKAYRKDSSMSVLLFYMAEVEMQLSAPRYGSATDHLRSFLADPAGNTMQDAQLRERLEQRARYLLSRIDALTYEAGRGER